MRERSQSGQTTVLVLGLALVAFSVAGLAVDGTKAFLFRRSLQNAADAAAVAAAGELDRVRYYASGGGALVLDPRAAGKVAEEILSTRRLPARAAVTTGREGVTVVLRGRVPTSFLRLVGIDSVPVAAEARAEPIAGSP